MKKRFLAGVLATLALFSCSSVRTLQTQAFDDGIYTRPAAQPARAAVSDEEVDNLLADSHQSPVYIINSGDTLVVPPGKTVRFKTDDQVITVTDEPDWAWTYSPWYMRGYYPYWDPWYLHRPYYSYYYSYWRWDPWYYSSWYFDPWYYGYSYYDPWYYSYYSPYYWGGWHGYHHHYYGYNGWGGHRPWNPNGRAMRSGHRDSYFPARGGAARPTVNPTVSSSLARSVAATRTSGAARSATTAGRTNVRSSASATRSSAGRPR